MNCVRRATLALVCATLASLLVSSPGMSQAEVSRAALVVTLGPSSKGNIYEGGRVGLIARNAPARATVTYEVWSGSSWRRGGTARASSYGSALWSTTAPMGASSMRVRVRVGKTVSRPITFPIKASDGWQYWDQTHLGSGGILKRLVAPDGSTIDSGRVFPLPGSAYELIDAWGERLLVSRSSGSVKSVYAWDPSMREAQYVMNVSAFDDYVSFGRSPEEVLVLGMTYVGTGLGRSQFEDLTAYTLTGQKKELLARFPQDPYGTLSYIEATSHVVDRASGRVYFTRYWDYYPRRSNIPREYAVTVLRQDGPPINTSLTSQQMLTDGTWTQRYGVVHRIPETADLVTDIQVRAGTGAYRIANRNFSGGSACAFSLSSPAETPARCVRVNSGEFIAGFSLQNSSIGLVLEYVDNPRDFIVREINFTEGVDKGMEGRATAVAFGGK